MTWILCCAEVERTDNFQVPQDSLVMAGSLVRYIFDLQILLIEYPSFFMMQHHYLISDHLILMVELFYLFALPHKLLLLVFSHFSRRRSLLQPSVGIRR